MTRKSHSRQYCFRISLDNPEHLRVYRTLEDLNLNIHKSISSFVTRFIWPRQDESFISELKKIDENIDQNG